MVSLSFVGLRGEFAVVSLANICFFCFCPPTASMMHSQSLCYRSAVKLSFIERIAFLAACVRSFAATKHLNACLSILFSPFNLLYLHLDDEQTSTARIC